MASYPTLDMEKLLWKDIRTEVHKVNSELATLIDQAEPDPECCLYRVKYKFGSTIVKNGVLHLPAKSGELIPVNSSTVAPEILEDLGSILGMPPGIILNNNIEFFLQNVDDSIPVALYQKGAAFGFYRVTNTEERHWNMPNIWHITAGSRSLIMLPKITDSAGYLRLRKEFNLRTYLPTDLSAQWPLFTELANHPNFPQPWSLDLLFFSKKWLTQVKNPHWEHFWYYILLNSWNRSDFWRSQWLFNYFFSCVQQVRNLKPNPYLADTVKHLFSIGAGVVPGLGVAVNNSSAPIEGFQQIFNEVYGLKSYAPIMLHAKYFNINVPDEPVYYSLQLPTTTEFSPKSRRVLSNMMGLQEIKYIMEKFIAETLYSNIVSEKDNCRYFAERLLFQYFHADEDPRGEILPTSLLIQQDSQLSLELKRFPDRTFPENAPFWKGCVQISSVNEDK